MAFLTESFKNRIKQLAGILTEDISSLGQFQNTGFIIKKKNDNEYVTYNDNLTSLYSGYAITHNRDSAKIFNTKKEAIDCIVKNSLQLHLMSDFVVEPF